MTLNRRTFLAGLLVAVVGAVAYVRLSTPPNPLQVALLDVGGYDEPMPVWMAFRVTLGLTNTGRDLMTLRRVHVEPDFDDFNEAYNVGTIELRPPLVVEPGQSVSYQAAVTLLNAAQLDEGTRPLTLRVRIEQDGQDVVYAFPAQFDHSRRPDRRALRY